MVNDSGGDNLALHGAIVLDVGPVQDEEHDVQVALVSGERRRVQVRAGGHPPLAIGQVGVLRVPSDGHGGWYFNAYLEQRLRRMPERDAGDGSMWAWRLDGSEHVIELYAGVVPGLDGAFVPDETEVVELGLPLEFLNLCDDHGLDPVAVLRGFIADLCGLQNYVRSPREDGLSSHGSDERMYAQQWFERAYPDFGEDPENLGHEGKSV